MHWERLKTQKLGVGAQLPKDIRDAQKPLYPVIKKDKDDGNSVKFTGKKLYIDSAEYVQPAAAMHQQRGRGEHYLEVIL